MYIWWPDYWHADNWHGGQLVTYAENWHGGQLACGKLPWRTIGIDFFNCFLFNEKKKIFIFKHTGVFT